MDHVRNPMYAAEPYEESQGRDSSPASPADLAAFYKHMEQKEIVERKLSKRRSNSGTSIWSRKSVKRSATAPPAPPPIQKPLPKQHPYENEKRRKEVEEREAERLEEDIEKPDWVPPMNSPRSIIPETMKELPAWYNKDTWSSVPVPSFKLRYNLHNPVGPRWYKNHHLIPPSQVRSTARPPTVFSPSFPPITSSSGHERSEDAIRVAGPSRTSSNSPLATPSSSQTRVVDGNKPRSRKTSETAHDNVDLLDVTDPWGTNWHHHSPYDIGLGNEPVSVDVQNPSHARTRRFSLTAQSRRKTVTPSPLSQSTSAVHLHVPDTSTIHMPRKLSKRRTPALANIFGGHAPGPARNAVSLPATPVEHIPYSMENFRPSQLPKRMSVAPLGSASAIQPHESTPKKEKRGSVLGRLVKKFSILRKSPGDQTRASGRENDWQHVNTDEDQRLDIQELHAAPEKPQSVISKRVPPPSIDAVPSAGLNDKPRDVDRSSSISLETPFSMGRLTIANPDAPGSADTTPAFNEAPLPPESRAQDSYVSTYLAYNDALERDPQKLPTHKSPTDSPPNILPLVQPLPNSERHYLPLPSSTSDVINNAPTTTFMRNSKAPQSPESPSPVFKHNPGVSSHQPGAPPSNYSDSPSTLDSQIPGPPTERSMTYSPLTVTSHQRLSSAESHTSRASETSQGVMLTQSNAKPFSFAPSVPFPTTQSVNEHYLTPEDHHSYDHSPLSAASMLANPPTPYADDMSMPATPEIPPPALPSKLSQEKKLSSHESSSSNHATGRQTETFKLIRSPSGNVYASSETIVAGGQQWEVVESMDNKGKVKGKGSSKSKDPETNSRREQRREWKAKANGDVETESRNRSQRRSQRQRSGERTDTTDTALSRRTSNDLHHQKADTGTTEVRHNTTRSSRKHDEDRKSDRKLDKSSVPINVNKPQPAPPPPTPGAPARPLQRNPSISARPTSELPSAAEMNALRAKEAWEMERLWKARSMYGDEANSFGNTAASANNYSPKPSNAQDTIHGSSHTAFVVQTPFRGQPSQIYHSMPAAPPQIIYPLPSSTSNSHPHLTSPSSHQSQIFPPDYLSSDRNSLTSSLRPALINPLPEPPRESSYEPAPIPLDIGSRPTDYWTTYTGLATLH